MLWHRRVLLQPFSHIRRAEQQENREEGHKRERERAAGIGGIQTSKMKQGEIGGMKRMTMSEIWKRCTCGEKGRTRTVEKLSTQSITNKCIIFRTQLAFEVWLHTDYWTCGGRCYRSRGMIAWCPSAGRSWDFGYCGARKQTVSLNSKGTQTF